MSGLSHQITISFLFIICLELIYIMNKQSLTFFNLAVILLFNVGMIYIIYDVDRLVSRPRTKPSNEYVTFGSTMNDAIYGNKYRYDLILDRTPKHFDNTKKDD
jgi:hypothetical protein